MAKQKKAWDKLTMLEKALLIKLSIESGISDLKLIRDTYNLYSDGGSADTYNTFVETLPDNMKYTDPAKYDMYRYWELNGRPKDFEEAKKREMFHKESDGYYHASTLAEVTNSPDKNYGTLEFIKAKNHNTIGLEVGAYLKDKNHPMRNREYILDYTGDKARYRPRTYAESILPEGVYVGNIPITALYAEGGTLAHKKSTGGPLYPFSFEKNPFLKTPVVRYDEGGKIRDWDNYLTGKLINYAENSDSIGWIPADRTWEHPTLEGYDKNQIGMGVDKNQTEGYSEVIQFRRDGTPFMTELDERRLRHAAIEKANTSANARYEFAQKEVNRPDGTISPVKDAAVVSAIYNLGAGYVANGLFEDKNFMLKLFDGTDKEVVDRINLEYKKKNRNERIAKTNQFLFK